MDNLIYNISSVCYFVMLTAYGPRGMSQDPRSGPPCRFREGSAEQGLLLRSGRELRAFLGPFAIAANDEMLFQAMEHLQAFIGDCDRRTEAAKQRLAETQEELSAEVAVKANSVHELAEQIGQKLAKAEQLGEEGFVEESMKLMEEVRIFILNSTTII